MNALATVEKREVGLLLRAPLADMGIADSEPPAVRTSTVAADGGRSPPPRPWRRESASRRTPHTYDTMPLYPEYRRQRDYSGSSSSSSRKIQTTPSRKKQKMNPTGMGF